MRAFRFGLGLTGTGTFTFGMFVVPVLVAALRGDLLNSVELEQVPDERVVYYEPPAPPKAGGGTSDPQEVADEQSTDDGAPGEDMLAKKSDSGSASSGSGHGVAAARSVRGLGAGNAGGTGPITMYRPDHAQRVVEHTERPGRSRCEPTTDAIVKTGARQWQIERDLVEEYNSIKKAQTLVGWVDRHKNDDGDKDGVVVGGIRCGTPLHLAGIRSGDVVHDVNGHEIKGIMSALGAWRKLKKADTLEVNITREGRPIRVRYTIT